MIWRILDSQAHIILRNGLNILNLWSRDIHSDKLQIHISTAFYWRHKILYALGSQWFSQLQGIVG